MAGSGAFLVVGLFLDAPDGLFRLAALTFLGALIVDLFITLVGEFSIPHASEVAARAAHDISHGHYRNYFWWGSIALGHAAPLVLVLVAALNVPAGVTSSTLAAAGVLAIIGLYFFEYAFVMAPQEIPNS